MAILINGNGNQAIYAAQDADWYASIFGGQTAITGIGYQFEASLLDANTIGVKDGVIITQEGRRIQIDANVIDTFDIPTGAQGTTNYYIIGYHLVTGTQSEQTCETFVRLMANATDTIPEGTFRGGDDDIYISLYRVTQDDLTITDIDLLLPTVRSITELNNDLTDLDRKINMTVNFNDYITTIGTTSGAQTYTATKKCVGFYNYRAISGSYSASGVNVNGHPVFANVSVNMSDSIGAVKLELQAGDVVTFTNIQANANLLYVYGVL